ncbi:hypothetical protein MHPYR_10279 [uncultured Mycobacterium sp.]|uniref:Uncharacterized protein n=1 Tax=uncultured Mycobacterium sp. TaxID=171292 RepID=A0A1Y5P3M4_9MYCO|nr:hypothetical protein MHPYR_10279 [uncultured Mycobacterium sp.]
MLTRLARINLQRNGDGWKLASATAKVALGSRPDPTPLVGAVTVGASVEPDTTVAVFPGGFAGARLIPAGRSTTRSTPGRGTATADRFDLA